MQGRIIQKKSPRTLIAESMIKESKPLQNFHKLPDQKTTPSKRRSSAVGKTVTKRSYLIDDNDYNSMLYEWRKTINAPIVKVYALQEKKEINRRTGQLLIRKVVRVENIKERLTEINEVSIGESLYILTNMLDGHQAIFKKLGATSVSLDKCGINEEGELKVWINHYFDRNDMSGEILSSQSRVVQKIFQIINLLTAKKLQNFRSYVEYNVQHNKWSFALMKKMIRSYTQSLRISLPKSLAGTQMLNLSLIMKKQKINKENSRPGSFYDINYSSPTNIQSSLTTYFNQKHRKVTSNTSMKKSLISTNEADSVLQFGSGRFSEMERRRTCLPSLNNMFTNKVLSNEGSANQFKFISLEETSREEENTESLASERKNKKQFLTIKNQYTYSFSPSVSFSGLKTSEVLKKGEKQSLISTENQTTNNDSRFMRLKTSSVEKESTIKKFPFEMKSQNMPSFHDNSYFNATFGKSTHGIEQAFPELQEEVESFENTSSKKSFDSPEKNRMKEKGERILKLLNKQIAISTYIDHSSQKKLSQKNFPPPASPKRLADLIMLEEGLQKLMELAKEEEVIQNNCWTKKLEGLFSLADCQLKESISCETEEAQNLFKEIKLTSLENWGREVKGSVIPSQ